MQSERRSRIGARRGHLESCSSNWFRLDVEAWICLRLWRGLRWSIVNQVCVENSIQVMSVTSLVSKSKNCFCRELCLHFERVTVRFVRRPGWNLAEGEDHLALSRRERASPNPDLLVRLRNSPPDD